MLVPVSLSLNVTRLLAASYAPLPETAVNDERSIVALALVTAGNLSSSTLRGVGDGVAVGLGVLVTLGVAVAFAVGSAVG